MLHLSDFSLLVTEGQVVMNRTYQGPDRELGLVIRRATFENADNLTTICRLCYPDMLKWRGPRFHTRKWWRTLLDAEYCELWVGLSDGRVIGYITLVLDRAQFVEALGRHRAGLLAASYMFATCPRLCIRRGLQKLKLSGTESLGTLVRSPSDDCEIHPPGGSRRLSDSEIPWAGPVAVIPSMQGHGVGTEMVKLCLRRAIEFGYGEIGAYVLRSNTRPIGLLKRLGFVMTHEGQRYVTYRKALTEELPPRAKSTQEQSF